MREGLDGFQGFFIFREHLDPADALRGCSALNRADFFAGIGRVDDPDLFYCILTYACKKNRVDYKPNSVAGSSVETVDVSNYATGLYWIRITVGSITTSKLFMKK